MFEGALYIDQGLEAVTVFCIVVMFNKLQVCCFVIFLSFFFFFNFYVLNIKIW